MIVNTHEETVQRITARLVEIDAEFRKPIPLMTVAEWQKDEERFIQLEAERYGLIQELRRETMEELNRQQLIGMITAYNARKYREMNR
jgi:hypothetical protein